MTYDIFIAIAVATVIFLTVSFTTDIRERMIYAFPCMVLILSWILMGVIGIKDTAFVITVLLLHLFVYSIMRILKIWGDGDSDVFLLYGAVYAALAMITLDIKGMSAYRIMELIGMIVALLLSFGIAGIEALIRKEKLGKQRSIAVVPGFSIVMIFMIVRMFFVR